MSMQYVTPLGREGHGGEKARGPRRTTAGHRPHAGISIVAVSTSRIDRSGMLIESQKTANHLSWAVLGSPL